MRFIKLMKTVAVACGARRLVQAFSARRRRPPPFLRMYRRLSAGEQLPLPDVSEPYRLRHYVRGDEQEWLELLNASGEFAGWDRARLEKELLSTLLPDGGVFAVHEGRIIGCASACLTADFAPDATLMYVALLKEHRGKGLGQAMVLETLRVCQRARFPGMALHTQNHRLAAVRSYFRLGFTPRLAGKDAGRAQWSAVLNKAFLEEVGR